MQWWFPILLAGWTILTLAFVALTIGLSRSARRKEKWREEHTIVCPNCKGYGYVMKYGEAKE